MIGTASNLRAYNIFFNGTGVETMNGRTTLRSIYIYIFFFLFFFASPVGILYEISIYKYETYV